MDEYLEFYQEEMEIVQSMPRVNRITVVSILAEIGTDLNPFPTGTFIIWGCFLF
jgi:hypothetical protein